MGYCLFFCIALSVVPEAMAQQTATVIRHSIPCPNCRVEFTREATLGKRTDAARIADLTTVARDAGGRYFTLGDELQVLVYDREGNFLRTVGRRGEGPGEFRQTIGVPQLLIGANDTLFVFIPPNISVFSPQLTFVRTVTLPVLRNPQSIALLADGSWVIAAEYATPEAAGIPFHVFDARGALVRSFGPQSAVLPGVAFVAPRFILAPDKRTIWFSTRYLFEQWSVAGSRVSRFEISDVPWLPSVPVNSPRATGRGTANMNGVDIFGNLWMVGRPSGQVTMRSTAQGSASRLLEVIDPRSGAVKSSQTVSQPMPLLGSGDFAWSTTTEGDGFRSITIWKYHLTGQQ